MISVVRTFNTPAGVAQLLPCDDNVGVSYGWKIVDGMWEAPPPSPEDEEQAQEGGN